MVSDSGFSRPRAGRLFRPVDPPINDFPIQSVRIDWERLITKRRTVLDTIDAMPVYMVKLEILTLLDAEKHPTFRLILDLM